MHDPGLSCICIYIHPQVLTLIASVYLNCSTNCSIRLMYGSCVVVARQLSSRNIWNGVPVSFSKLFRKFFFFCDPFVFVFSFLPFLVQRARTRKKLILNNRWNKRFERFHTRFFFFFRIFGDYGGFRILMDLLKRGWSFVRIVDYVLFMFVIQIRKERVINRFSIQMNPILSYNSQKWDRVSPRFKLLIRRIFEIVVATFIEIIGRIVGLQ